MHPILIILIIVVIIIIIIVNLIKKGITSIGVSFKSIRPKKNTKRFMEYLEKNMLYCGYLPYDVYSRLIPMRFKELKYYTVDNPTDSNYSKIVQEFMASVESKYISGIWITPAIAYLRTHVMADTIELLKLDYPELKYTHWRRNDEMLVYELSRRTDISDISLTAKDLITEEAEENGFKVSSSFYHAFKMNNTTGNSNYFETKEISLDDIESEEFSLDDL